MITGLYAGILGFIYIALSWNIIMKRREFKVGIGDGGNQILKKAIRAHGNFAEYVPLILIMMILVEYTTANTVMMHALGVILVIARLLQAIGLLKTEVVSIERVVGTLTTFAIMAVLALMLIYQFVIS